MDENYSSLSKLIVVAAWILRFIRKLKHKKKETGPLTASELKDAKTLGVLHSTKKLSRSIQSYENESKKHFERATRIEVR